MDKRLLLGSIALISLAGAAWAQTDPGDFLGSTSDAVIKFFAELSRRLIFTGMMWTKINDIKYEVYNNLPDYLLKNPDVADPGVLGLIGYFLRIIQPLYVTAIIATGIYLLFFSGTPAGRFRAKNALIKLIIGMVAVTLFLPILQTLFSLADTLTKNILAQGPYDAGFTYRRAIDYLTYRAVDFMWGDIVLGLPFLLLSLAVTTGLFLMLAARQFMLIFLVVFFPVAVFLYLFDLTKNIGQMFLRQLLFWLFLPVGYALVLVTMSMSSQTLMFLMIELADIVSLAAGLMLLASPLVMLMIVNWTVLVITSSVILMEPISRLAGAPAEDRGTEASAAVGIRGYRKVAAKKKEGKQETTLGAVGSKGYRRIGKMLAGSGFGAPKAAENEKPGAARVKKSIIPMSLMSRIMAEEEERGKLVKDRYGADQPKKKSVYEDDYDEEGPKKKTDSGKDAARGVGPSMRLASSVAPPKKETDTVVGTKHKWSKSMELAIGPGESDFLHITIINDDAVTYYKVSFYDDGLTDAGFDVSYSDPSFSLPAGQDKNVKIKIAAPEGMEKKEYEGIINCKTEKGILGTLEVKVVVGDKRARVFDLEDDSDIGFSRAAESPAPEKGEKIVEKTNVFGEKEMVKLGADGKTAKPGESAKPKEKTVSSGLAFIKTSAKQPEKDESVRVAEQKGLELMGPVLSASKAKKMLKLIKPGKKKEGN